MEVLNNHSYAAAGHQRAHLHHHAPIKDLSKDQLAQILHEHLLSLLGASSKSVLFEEELATNPSVDTQDSASEDKLPIMMAQWDLIVSTVKKLTLNLGIS